MQVKDVMTTQVVTVRRDTLLKDAARALVANGVSGLPVVGDDGTTVLGVLSEADIVAKERHRRSEGGFLSWLVAPADTWLEQRLEATTAGEAMSTPAVTIAPGRLVAEAAAMMLDEGVNRLPVVDADDRLVGLVSRGDLVRTFVRADEEIRAEIEDVVIKKTLWLDPTTLGVGVEDGAVTLAGEVDTEQDAQLLEAFAQRVPGVVSVTSTVRSRAAARA